MTQLDLMVANILDDCARLLALTSMEDDPTQTFHTINRVGGELSATSDALHAGDTHALEAIATALDGEVTKRQMQVAQTAQETP